MSGQKVFKSSLILLLLESVIGQRIIYRWDGHVRNQLRHVIRISGAYLHFLSPLVVPLIQM